MTNHWNQKRSAFRTGEPKDHWLAKETIAELLEGQGYDVHKEYPLVDPMEHGYKHNYDIVAFGKVFIIEIDDPNLHAKPRKKANDKIAEGYAMKHFPMGLTFIRLDKDELNDTDPGEYITEHFWSRVLPSKK